MTQRQSREVIGLWLDTESGNAPAWIVSCDLMNQHGEAETTHTVAIFSEANYTAAYTEAMRLGKKLGKEVIETPEHGNQVTHYNPTGDCP